jgi:hypothetical protein
VPRRGAYSHYISGVVEPRMFMFPSSPVGAKDQPRSVQRPEDQPPSGQDSALLPLRRQIKVEQPPSWRAPSVVDG